VYYNIYIGTCQGQSLIIINFILTTVGGCPYRRTVNGKPNMIAWCRPSNHFAIVVDKISQRTDTATSGFTFFVSPTPTHVSVLTDIVIVYGSHQFIRDSDITIVDSSG
jgi:hypothetical protein